MYNLTNPHIMIQNGIRKIRKYQITQGLVDCDGYMDGKMDMNGLKVGWEDEWMDGWEDGYG